MSFNNIVSDCACPLVGCGLCLDMWQSAEDISAKYKDTQEDISKYSRRYIDR